MPAHVILHPISQTREKNPIFRLSEHFKVYKYQLEEDLSGHAEKIEEITQRTPSESIQKRISFKIEDLYLISFEVLLSFFMSCGFSVFEMFPFQIMN